MSSAGEIFLQVSASEGGAGFLPGTPRAAARFARAPVYLHSIPTGSKPAYISGVPQRKFSFRQ